MADSLFVLQFDPSQAVLPLRAWWNKLPEGKMAYDTVEDMARRGVLVGAFKPDGSRDWWINLLAIMQEGLSSDGYGQEKSAAPKGNGLSYSKAGPVLRKNPGKGPQGRADGAVRQRRRS